MTKRINTSFATMMLALTVSLSAMADVVYEPLIVESGFNRDVIAESTSIGTCAWSPLYDLTGGNSHTSCFATKAVITSINYGKFSDSDYAKTIAGGWPDDNGNPDDRVIRCSTEYLADAYQNPTFTNLYWRLAPYDGPNVLTLRPGDPDNDAKGWHTSGTLTFQKIGCYDQLFFLMGSLREGKAVGQRKVTTIVHYTDNSTSQAEFWFAGLGGEEGKRVQITNIYESTFKKNTATDPNLAYVSVFPMDVDPHKLIQSIEFTNNITNTSAIIFAVTGRTADMPIPAEEAATVSNIDANSFEACWEAISDAASYRLDVAEDPDFQHILEAYNNLVVTGTTCQKVAGLIADNDYYWRVRSVNSDGGQSASSAPRRVKTAGGEIPETGEEYNDIDGYLAPCLNTTYAKFKINRTLWRDGYYNTLCLPFNMTAEEIAASPLTGATVYEYQGATKLGGNQLDIEVSETYHITAGVPYLIRWPNMGDIIPAPLEFRDVTIRTNEGQTIGAEDEIRFVGNIALAALEMNNHNLLFIGANNTLYWPNTSNGMKGFRAHFEVPTEGPAAAPKNTPARIVVQEEVATGIENISNDKIGKSENVKILRNGQLYLLYNGVMYDVQGKKVTNN